MTDGAQARLRRLYFGDTLQARRFRFALLTIDAITILLFLVTAMVVILQPSQPNPSQVKTHLPR